MSNFEIPPLTTETTAAQNPLLAEYFSSVANDSVAKAGATADTITPPAYNSNALYYDSATSGGSSTTAVSAVDQTAQALANGDPATLARVAYYADQQTGDAFISALYKVSPTHAQELYTAYAQGPAAYQTTFDQLMQTSPDTMQATLALLGNTSDGNGGTALGDMASLYQTAETQATRTASQDVASAAAPTLGDTALSVGKTVAEQYVIGKALHPITHPLSKLVGRGIRAGWNGLKGQFSSDTGSSATEAATSAETTTAETSSALDFSATSTVPESLIATGEVPAELSGVTLATGATDVAVAAAPEVIAAAAPEATLAAVEVGCAGLDATGVGAIVGVTVGVVAAGVYLGYEASQKGTWENNALTWLQDNPVVGIPAEILSGPIAPIVQIGDEIGKLGQKGTPENNAINSVGNAITGAEDWFKNTF